MSSKFLSLPFSHGVVSRGHQFDHEACAAVQMLQHHWTEEGGYRRAFVASRRLLVRIVVGSIVDNKILERSCSVVVSTALAGVRIIAVSSLVEEDHWDVS